MVSGGVIGERSRELDGQLVQGIAWTGISRLFGQLLSWTAFLVVARILSPGEIGITVAATAVVGIVSLLSEFGLGAAIVAKADLTEDEINQLAGTAALTGVGAWLTCAMLAWPISQVLRIDELWRVLPVLGLTVCLSTVTAVPMAVLRRAMRFRTVAQLEVVRSVVSSTAMIGLVFAGFGFWSLLLADVLSHIVTLLASLRRARIRFVRPLWRGVAETVRVSREVLIGRAAWYAYSNADFVVVSRQLGKATVGDYSMAWTLVNLPSEKVATLLMAVTPSILSRVRDDLVQFRRYVLLLLESLALVLMPAAAGIGLVASDAVSVSLGTKWEGATPVIQALAVFAVMKSLAPMTSQILIARGKAAAARRQSLWGCAILPISFLVASRWGVVAVALVWSTVYPVLILVQVREAALEIQLPMTTVLRRLAPIVASTSIMALAVVAIQQHLLHETAETWMRLLVSITAGTAVYAAALWILLRDRLRAAIHFIRHRN